MSMVYSMVAVDLVVAAWWLLFSSWRLALVAFFFCFSYSLSSSLEELLLLTSSVSDEFFELIVLDAPFFVPNEMSRLDIMDLAMLFSWLVLPYVSSLLRLLVLSSDSLSVIASMLRSVA
jgi:hypothetical protein